MPGDMVLEVVPVIATGLFAGAALGVTVGEQPARELLDAQHAKKHFLESYQRIAVSQVRSIFAVSVRHSDDALLCLIRENSILRGYVFV